MTNDQFAWEVAKIAAVFVFAFLIGCCLFVLWGLWREEKRRKKNSGRHD